MSSRGISPDRTAVTHAQLLLLHVLLYPLLGIIDGSAPHPPSAAIAIST